MGTKTSGLPGVFGFDSALLILKAGGRVRRTSWGEHGNWVGVKVTSPSEHQKLATMQKQSSDGFDLPYTPSVSDLLSSDWTAEHIGDMLMTKEA